ncbi:MAG: hypothetical protein R3268_12415 [Acidiferrobacterales bacterium]|nr:hypothetical protein [Acidiferrobacterales bacterium]
MSATLVLVTWRAKVTRGQLFSLAGVIDPKSVDLIHEIQLSREPWPQPSEHMDSTFPPEAEKKQSVTMQHLRLGRSKLGEMIRNKERELTVDFDIYDDK